MKTRTKILSLTLSLILAMVIFTGCSSSDSDSESETIRIVHKNYTEQRILGSMLGQYLEAKGYDTTVSELGGSMLCFNALTNGDADLYPEYTGTGYCGILDETEILPAEETYDFVKKAFEENYGITWLKPLGFNNTYVFSVTQETIDKYDIETISDLIPYAGDMTLGSDAEFTDRVDGLPGLLKVYEGLEFKDTKSMDQGLTYQALIDGSIDVNVSYATDGRIAKYNLVNLVDDRNFFPPYYLAPILKTEFADANPEVVTALEALENKFSDEDMQKYNQMVDDGESPDDVARKMLEDKGLI
ncbi:MAG: glycine/betaine ABC transporter substrate-binding protein [Peptostreptococcaceae bacterium]|nr:glycine/betaine ABC transporter substrate-binding protein [Peptostreptococcaceae bacterium]